MMSVHGFLRLLNIFKYYIYRLVNVKYYSIVDLQGRVGSADGEKILIDSYYANGLYTTPKIYGIKAVWSSTALKSTHDGVIVHSPTVPWDGTQAGLAAYQAKTGETDISGAGCWLVKYRYMDVHVAGAVGNDTVDDTGAINNCAAAVGALGGGKVYLPEGTYRLTSAINVANQSVSFEGASRFKTLLKQYTTDAKILNVTGLYFSLKSMSFNYSGTPVSGATAIYIAAKFAHLTDFMVRASYVAVHFYGGAGGAGSGKMSNFNLLDHQSVGILTESVNDIYVNNFVSTVSSDSMAALGHIRLLKKAEAINYVNGDVFGGKYSLTSDATTYAAGSRPAYNNFTNIYFDSSTDSSLITKMVETDFVGCWFSSGRSGAGTSGAIIYDCDSVRFTNTRFFNCGAHGANVKNTANDIAFVNCKFESNSVTKGTNVSSGLNIENGSTNFSVIGCSAKNGLFPGVQGYGITIGAGCDNFTLIGNRLTGNGLGSLLDGAAAATEKYIQNNLGYRTENKGTATILNGSTSVTVAHSLNITPTSINVTPMANLGGLDYWVDTIGASTFKINVSSAVGADKSFSWRV